MILGFAIIFYQYAPKRERPNPRPEPISWTAVLVLVVGLLAGLGLVAFQILRSFDWGVRRASKRAHAGDLDGAIEDLREQIEFKGPTQFRVNALGVLLLRGERWAEAAALYRKSEAIGEFKGVFQANLGLALLKSGQPAEALSVLQEAVHIGPRAPAMTCLVGLRSALALAELSRWEEAHEQFRAAEEAAGGLRNVDRVALNETFEQCRQKLEQDPHGKPRPEGLSEL